MCSAHVQDIIGDLYRLRQELLSSGQSLAADRYYELEVLAAIAVVRGMSHNIVTKASHVARDSIDSLIAEHPDQLARLADSLGYHRIAGVVTRNA